MPPLLSADGLEVTGFALDQWTERTRQAGAELVVMSSHSMSRSLRVALSKLAADRRIPLVDQVDYIRRQGGSLADARFPNDEHWSPLGHRWAAEALVEWLAENRWVCDAREASLAPVESAPVEQVPAEPTFTPYTSAPRIVNTTEVQKVLAQEYPPLLRDAGIGGTVSVHLYIDVTGNPANVLLHRSSGHAALDEAALRAAESFNFSPAKNREETVPAWIRLPLSFSP